MKITSHFFTSAESIFYRQLLQAVDGLDLLVFPKVRLIDAIEFSSTEENQKLHYSVISKHVDFLLCSDYGIRPVAVIELDDSSHLLPEVRERDAIKNLVCAACDLPLIRFGGNEPKRSYFIRQRLDMILKPTLRAVSV